MTEAPATAGEQQDAVEIIQEPSAVATEPAVALDVPQEAAVAAEGAAVAPEEPIADAEQPVPEGTAPDVDQSGKRKLDDGNELEGQPEVKKMNADEVRAGMMQSLTRAVTPLQCLLRQPAHTVTQSFLAGHGRGRDERTG
jgi:hypothetical protein